MRQNQTTQKGQRTLAVLSWGLHALTRTEALGKLYTALSEPPEVHVEEHHRHCTKNPRELYEVVGLQCCVSFTEDEVTRLLDEGRKALAYLKDLDVARVDAEVIEKFWQNQREWARVLWPRREHDALTVVQSQYLAEFYDLVLKVLQHEIDKGALETVLEEAGDGPSTDGPSKPTDDIEQLTFVHTAVKHLKCRDKLHVKTWEQKHAAMLYSLLVSIQGGQPTNPELYKLGRKHLDHYNHYITTTLPRV